MATAKYLIFLDSHCEVTGGWLEPLLERLQRHRGIAVSPAIDVIDPQTFEYRMATGRMRAGFDWSLQFQWIMPTVAAATSNADRFNETLPYAYDDEDASRDILLNGYNFVFSFPAQESDNCRWHICHRS